MKIKNFFSIMAIGVVFILVLAAVASQAYAELKINSVYDKIGIKGKDLPVTISGSGFDVNTRVSIYPDTGSKKRIVGSLETPGYAQDITVVGNYAYVADDSSLQVIDISNTFKPVIVGAVDTPGSAMGVTAAGNYVYVADWDSGLQIIDISNPSNLAIIGAVDTPGTAGAVILSGNYAYVADGDSGLQVIDISNPSKPAIIGSVDTPGHAYAVSISGNYAYVTDGDSGLQVIDVSNPSKPVIISANTHRNAMCITIFENYAYIGGDRYFTIIDISNPYKSDIIGSIKFSDFFYIHDIAVIEKYAYIIASNDGSSIFYIIDISNPSQPVIPFSIVNDSEDLVYAKGITAVGNYAYVADYDRGLQIIYTQIFKPPNIVSVNMPDYQVQDLAVAGNYAYVISSNTFYTIDISNPSKPVIMGTRESNPNDAKDLYACNDIKISGNYAYIVDSGCGCFHVMDISNPSHPVLISTISTMNIEGLNGGSAWGVAVSGNYAYVLDWTTGFEVIDISQPSQPVIISPESSGGGYAVTVVGNYAYVAYVHGTRYVDTAEAAARLAVINISDPYKPFWTGFVDMPSDAYDVKVVGNYAYVAAGDSGLLVIDVSNPSAPVIIGSVKTGYAEEVSIIGNYAYVANGYAIDISKPSEPIIIGLVDTVDTLGLPFKVSAVGKYVYLLNEYAGLVILSIPEEVKPVNINSSNSNSINVTLPSPQLPGDYTIRVFNNNNEYSELKGAVTFVPPEESYLLDTKAIIVVGDKSNNPIRNETLMTADFAYKTLLFQGYTAESVNYLSFDTSQPGVDGKASLVAISDAVNNWSIKDPKATELLIYLVGHGENGYFIINDNEHLTVEQLDQWLDNLQNTYDIPVTVIYDACHSGSFLPKLTPPVNKKRVVISSASSELAYFPSGVVSFSYQFWNAVYQGSEIGKAFRIASNQMQTYQTALMDADGDGIGTEAEIALAENMKVRRNYKPLTDVPYIYKVSDPQVLHDQTSAKIIAGVSYVQDGTKVQRVWATIEPPDFKPDGPVTNLPEIKLTDPDGDGIYEGVYNGFAVNGTYKINVCAMNQKGMYALFRHTTVVRETEYIATVSQPQVISQNSAKIWAALKPDIPVSRVWAKITPPVSGASHVEIELSDPEHDGIYEAVFEGFSAEGTYAAQLYATDTQGYTSPAVMTTITYGSGAGRDDYEQDNMPELARYLSVGRSQEHNFHVSGDTDWIKILPQKGITYNLKITNQNLARSSVDFYKQAIWGDANGDKKVDMKDVIFALQIVAGLGNTANIFSDADGDGRIGLEEALYGLREVSGLNPKTGTIKLALLKTSDAAFDWTCPENGFYYLHVRNTSPDVFGQNVKYGIELYRPAAGSTGTVRGTVKSSSGEPVAEAMIFSDGGGTDMSRDNGAFSITDPVGKHIITVRADGYEEYRTAVSLTETTDQVLSIVMIRNR